MTDDRLDDLASAHLDGATSPEEAAEVVADPRLQARMEELRAVRAAIRTVTPVDPRRRDLAIAAALAAFDEPTAPVTGRVTSLTGVAARRGPSTRSLRLLGAAAAAALLVALVPVLARLGRSEDKSTAASTAQDSAGTPAAGDGDGRASQSEAGAAMSTTTAAARISSLGRFDSVEGLVAAIERPDPSATQFDQLGPDASGDLDATCPAQRAQAQSLSPRPLVAASAVVAGTPVTVLVSTTATGSRVVEAVLTAECTPLATGP